MKVQKSVLCTSSHSGVMCCLRQEKDANRGKNSRLELVVQLTWLQRTVRGGFERDGQMSPVVQEPRNFMAYFLQMCLRQLMRGQSLLADRGDG